MLVVFNWVDRVNNGGSFRCRETPSQKIKLPGKSRCQQPWQITIQGHLELLADRQGLRSTKYESKANVSICPLPYAGVEHEVMYQLKLQDSAWNKCITQSMHRINPFFIEMTFIASSTLHRYNTGSTQLLYIEKPPPRCRF
jgi:hypothetical protein